MMRVLSILAALALVVGCQVPSEAQASAGIGTSRAAARTIAWKGHIWDVGIDPMGGATPGQIESNPANVSVDSNGYLHLRISQSGGVWTGAELVTQDNMGFGTYNFQVEGAVTSMEKGVVLGLFPAGPAHGIGQWCENEIDIEFSKWNNPSTGNNADFTYYPPTGFGDPVNYTPSWTKEFAVNLGSNTLTTSRIEWSPTAIVSRIMTGLQPIGTVANVVSPSDATTYAPANPTTKIPQVACPIGINLWTYGSKPTKSLEIIIRDFQYVPAGPANLAPSGAGFVWNKNASATADTNKAARAQVNDGNLTGSTVLNPAGEGGAVKWQAAGVVWASAHTINSVKFINGSDDGHGNGYFQGGFKVQASSNGTTWADTSWTATPGYPNSAQAFGQTYTFSGTALTNVKGVRVVGQTGDDTWSGSVAEVQAFGH